MTDKGFTSMNQIAETLAGGLADGLTKESSEEDRLVAAATLVASGASVSRAAMRTGLSTDKVQAHLDEQVKEYDARISHKMLVALESALERAVALMDENKMRPSEVVKFFQTLSSLAAMKLKWNAPPPAPPEPDKPKSAMERLLEKLDSGDMEGVVIKRRELIAQGEVVDLGVDGEEVFEEGE